MAIKNGFDVTLRTFYRSVRWAIGTLGNETEKRKTSFIYYVPGILFYFIWTVKKKHDQNIGDIVYDLLIINDDFFYFYFGANETTSQTLSYLIT